MGIAHVSDAQALSKKLLAHYGTVWNILTSPIDELMSIQGVAEETAILINCIGNIYLRGQAQYQRTAAVAAPARAARILIPEFRGLDTEAVYALYLDEMLIPRGVDEVARGGDVSAHLDIFPVLSGAYDREARTVIIAHNHPACDPVPSGADRAATESLRGRLETLGIRLLDHMIVAGDTYVSFAADGLLDTMDGENYRVPAGVGVSR